MASLASLGLVADSLADAAHQELKRRQAWSATEWSEKREGWIFITSSATEREALRPLHSLWIDLLVSAPAHRSAGQARLPSGLSLTNWRVCSVSLSSTPPLQRTGRAGTRLSWASKAKAQLEVIYGHLAEVMLSQPATKIFLKTTEPKAAEWVSNAIGKVEIERMKETHFDGTRAGKNFSLDRQVEPLVMDSEISGLENRHAFLKLGNNVARFHFEYMDLPQTTPGFVPRRVEDDELPFDPKTLSRQRMSQSQPPLVDLEAEVPKAEPVAPPQAETSKQEAEAEEEDSEMDEPTEDELAVAGTYPDSLEDFGDADDNQANTAFQFEE